MTELTALPTEIREMVEQYMATAGVDFTNPEAVRGECETHARGLAAAMGSGEYDMDEDGWGEEYEAWAVQVWMDETPAALAGNAMAGGHFVTHVRTSEGEYTVDLTAAQFPEMGWTGPRAVGH